MIRLSFIRIGIALIALMTFAGTAAAQESLAKFIENVNGIEVRIQGNSEKCSIKDDQRYAATLKQALDEIGVTHDPVAIPRAYLFIWGEAFGPLSQQCAVFMSLRMGANISATAVRIEATLESDQLLVERFKAVEGTFPAAFYLVAELFVKLVPNAPDQVDTSIKQLVAEFEKVRKS